MLWHQCDGAALLLVVGWNIKGFYSVGSDSNVTGCHVSDGDVMGELRTALGNSKVYIYIRRADGLIGRVGKLLLPYVRISSVHEVACEDRWNLVM